MSTYSSPDGDNQNGGNSTGGQGGGQGGGEVQHGQNAVEGQGIDDPGTTSATPKPLSPEEYAQAKEEIQEQGDRNESGHANG